MIPSGSSKGGNSRKWAPELESFGRCWVENIGRCLTRDVLTRSASTGLWRRSTETALYLATTVIPAERAAIENTSHYTRDVTMGEDRSRIRSNPGVFARLRSFAFNILKANRRGSLPQDRFRAAIAGLAPLLKLLRVSER